MADRSCIHCEDRGDCIRCSYFFQPEKTHSKCGQKWSEHEVKTQDFYMPWAVCPVAHNDGSIASEKEADEGL